MSGVQSMTGFASASRRLKGFSLICDIRSVNNKGLDVRLRIPAGLEALELPIKKRISTALARGSIQLFLNVSPDEDAASTRIDEALFMSLADAGKRLAEEAGIAPPTADGLLSVRGVVTDEDGAAKLDPEANAEDVISAVDEALATLVEARSGEGRALQAVLAGQIDAIAALTERAAADPGSDPSVIHQRLRADVAALLQDESGIEPARLHAEAALLATKADIREEIDRLAAHVSAARNLLKAGGPIGRKLDFLAQEFNREANTVCSKAASASLTAIGLELKAVIDQFREQVQNLQ
ncbi:YicC/YloC family endoribonuclease [Oricola cellulosilytica]|uniref:YicC family protein n=1 Tax=Oricola cellulosilytica TaxID=1429082 RepID=A0A4R0PB80_9HYPH|nr:YicC/YloC family endoribonuclease [Oricola cellulosilytica]TCD14306.1 YicC family protein [Oricola cellulosilytica]